jgi:hypothetical protein
MKKIAFVFVALTISTVAPTLLFFSNSGKVKTQTTLSEETGKLRFIAGHRMSSPRIEVLNPQRKLTFICPINVHSFPCNDPKSAFNIVASRLGTVRYYKYDVATIDAGQGVVESIQIGSVTYKFPAQWWALGGLLWKIERNPIGVNLSNPAYAPEPNWSFNADANTGHGFAIFMASVGALRASRSGAG